MSRIFCISLLLFIFSKASAQINFTVKDTLCVNDSVFVENKSVTGKTYFWHFCSANLSYAPEGQSLGNLGNLNGPAFTALVKDQNDDYYAFTTNHTDGTITRLFIGKNLLNPPVAVNLGNIGGKIPLHTQGIQIKYSNGNWYGFVVGGLAGESKLVRLDFGPSLNNNNPAVVDFGNPGNKLQYPIDLYLLHDNTNWYGFTVNFSGNNVTRFDFGNNLINTPTLTNISNLGLSQPCGIMPVNSEGKWYFFISNFNKHSLTRLEFQSSLSNLSPQVTHFTNLQGLQYPFDLSVIRDCGKHFGFLVNRYGDACRLDFPSGLDNDPAVTSLGKIGGLSSPHGISDVYREGDTIYMMIANENISTLSRLYYPSCTAPTIFTSTQYQPPKFAYRFEGNFNIQLVINKGLPDEQALCKNVIVFPEPHTAIGKDTAFCHGRKITLHAGPEFLSYKWHDGSTDSLFVADTTQLVWVQAKNKRGCLAHDTVRITTYIKTVNLGNDTIIPRGEVFTLDAGSGYTSYKWSTGDNSQTITRSQEGKYVVSVVDIHNCPQSDDKIVRYLTYIPNFFTPNGDGSNDVWVIPFLDNFPNAEVKVFDRYGKLLHTQRGNNNSWDGTFNGKKLPKDSYWYFIDLKDGSEVIKGFVTIKY